MLRGRLLLLGALMAAVLVGAAVPLEAEEGERHLLYVASPGIRNYTEWGGVGVLVYDMDRGHKWVKRIPTWDVAPGQPAENVKGICASAATGRLYVSTPKRMACIDLRTEKMLWSREYPGGCDRMSITPDGKTIYSPSFEGPHWNVVDAITGDVITQINPDSGAHNTLVSRDGSHAFLAGLRSPLLRVVDTRTHKIVKEVGPFGHSIRPFTVNGAGTRCYVNVNELLGFEVGDLRTGKLLHRVEVTGFQKGPVKRHGCPSHGVGLTPDEREVWVSDAANSRMHVFDNTQQPPKQVASIPVRDQPGWVTFSLDGRYAYPSTGQVIDTKTRKVLVELSDEEGRAVQSEKVVEIVWKGDRPVRNGDQFGIGRRP